MRNRIQAAEIKSRRTETRNTQVLR